MPVCLVSLLHVISHHFASPAARLQPGEIEIRDKLPRGIEMFGSHLGLTIVHIFTPLTVERMTNPGSYDYYSP